MISSSAAFPATDLWTIQQFSKKANFYDKYIKTDTIDRNFIAVNVKQEDLPDNPDKAMLRCEFIEFLIRIAREKYHKGSEEAKSATEAFKMLINRNIMPVSQHHEWNTWREDTLYTY